MLLLLQYIPAGGLESWVRFRHPSPHGSGAQRMKKFEERLARLEEISEKIKSADLPLEEALAAFEEGIKLAKTLEKDIDKIESKVQILMNQPVQPQDKPELELFSTDDI